eukprot:TRINITY_DN1639_c0_g1_i1.p1 TRINITY_DN1639_c0_g1~~TRINITY_DN1639_c0_g1_i1.p1  ORF type:complete len:311 (-),score=29.01 TRINITY_DN1639_c0_g1_i1:334-1266(-)
MSRLVARQQESSVEFNPSQEIKQGLQQLGKRGTFFDGVKRLKLVSQHQLDAEQRQQLVAATKRCGHILRTRYTSPQFWTVGLELFQQVKTGQLQPLNVSEKWLDELINSALDVVSENRSTLEVGVGAGADILSPQHNPSSAARDAHVNLQQQILEGVHAIANGMEAISSGTERIEQELSRLMSITRSLREQADSVAYSNKPPASIESVGKLPRMKINSKNIDQLVENRTCAICMDKFGNGDDVIIMPCQHPFHYNCLKPWLKQTNSCPTCRSELATDNKQYEQWKKDKQEREEEERGVQNALSHNEFMYI